MTTDAPLPPPTPEMLATAQRLRRDFEVLALEKESAIAEVLTKVEVLRKEFLLLHRYNPIEHVSSRVKTPESILRKVVRKGVRPDIDAIRQEVQDIAGVRVTCSFVADTYRVMEALTAQTDIEVLELKDYIASPKPSGYRSLHAIVRVPVFLSTGPVPVTVEVQVRTIAMDFWASLEHKIFYKYEGDVPAHLTQGLKDAAAASAELDARMERLHHEVREVRDATTTADVADAQVMMQLWAQAHAAHGVRD